MRETQRYLVDQVQGVYRDQGVSIHDKHIELIVRQMTRRVLVNDAGDSSFLPGESIDGRAYVEANRKLVAEGKEPAKARPQLMGITKASLATDSWLSAASFQEQLEFLLKLLLNQSDNLIGLKENIIIGKLIPAGTGLPSYRDFSVETPSINQWNSIRQMMMTTILQISLPNRIFIKKLRKIQKPISLRKL